MNLRSGPPAFPVGGGPTFIENTNDMVARMSFDVAADAYDRFMGRYSRVLSPAFADFGARGTAGARRGLRAGRPDDRARAPARARVRGSGGSIRAVRRGCEGTASRRRRPTVLAERIPHPDGAFDVSMAQLVVHMRDPVAGLRRWLV